MYHLVNVNFFYGDESKKIMLLTDRSELQRSLVPARAAALHGVAAQRFAHTSHTTQCANRIWRLHA